MSRREWAIVAGAVALSFVIQLIYVIAVRHYKLAGDETEYNAEGLAISHGLWWYTRVPYGIFHAGAWEAPLYPLWVGFWYTIVGHHVTVVRLAQVVLGLATIPLAWLLARRLFGPRVAAAAVVVVALYPLAWQYDALLFPEALATPIYVGILIIMLTRPPSRRRAVALGLVMGLTILLRPSTAFLFLGVLVAWGLMAGWRRGLGLTALTVACAVLVVVPWTIRNEIVLHGFVPISLEESAMYGTFNSQSAHDKEFPYAWRAVPAPDAYLFNPRHPLSDVTLHSDEIKVAEDYIKAHPSSLLAAFFWNGLSRFWDIRHQSRALTEVPYEGRSRLVTEIGLDVYYVLLPLALIGLWRARRRRALVWGILALALGASIVFTTDSGTRYRAPLEPLIAVLACAGALGAAPPERRRDAHTEILQFGGAPVS